MHENPTDTHIDVQLSAITFTIKKWYNLIHLKVLEVLRILTGIPVVPSILITSCS